MEENVYEVHENCFRIFGHKLMCKMHLQDP